MGDATGVQQSDISLEVKNIDVSYKIRQQMQLLDPLLPSRRHKLKEGRYFQALKDVSFSVKKGEIVGVVGQNGSGKSTLLRTISGVFTPDNGTVDLHGNSVSLLAMGIGFQRQLTGRDNIYLSGMLLGFSKARIQEKFEQIIEFSELGDFIDRPVNTYSSGMNSKLAFSITAVLETDIILVDEVLSVGDARFRKKSFAKMKELIADDNRTVLIVSHSADQIRKLCTRAIWLDHGQLMMDDTVSAVMQKYDEDNG